MRIVHVITRLIVGGAQENTLLSCEGQHDMGHDVTLVTGSPTGPEGTLLERARGHGYRVIETPHLVRNLDPRADLAAYRFLERAIGGLRPDVVHTHSSKAGILGRFAARAARAKAVVHTIHGLAFTASGRAVVNAAYVVAERRAARLSDRICCVADAMTRQSLANGIGEPWQYVTVHSGMDVRPFLDAATPSVRAATRERLRLKPEHVAVGTIARLFDLKGHDDLIALAPDLCRRFPDVRFLWVGDGTLRPRFEREIAAAGLADRFVLAGLVSPGEIPELAGAMDVLVHPSRREGLARALPQGSLAGCPTLCYDVDGNAEALIEGVTGHAVRPFDVATLGDRLAELVADADRRRTMGEAGRAFVKDRFATGRMVEKLDRVYRDVLRTG